MQLRNKTVLITGGASGIGVIMVRLLLERKAKVVIWDINQTGIDTTVTDFSTLGVIIGFAVDISDPKQIKETAKKIKLEVGHIDVIINNAGIIVGKYFHEHSSDEIAKTIDINANAPMLITK